MGSAATPAVTVIVTSHVLYLSPLSRCSWSGYEICIMLFLAPLLQSVFSLLLSACCQWTSSFLSALFLYVFPSLRLLFLSGFFPPLSLSPPLNLSLISLSHCIHFCAFKKSPRITNLEERANQSDRGGLRTQNKEGPGPGIFYSTMRVKPL